MFPPIAILGAGPSGLALAGQLEKNGIDFVIYERDQSPNEIGQGGSLDIHAGSGQIAFREIGLFEQFKAKARYDAQASRMVDRHGELVFDTGNNESQDAPEIDRKDLRALLLEGVPSSKICWGYKVKEVRRESDKALTIHFADGKVEGPFKLVVGADGIWSKARPLVTDAKPQYSGIHYISTSIQPSNVYHVVAKSLVGQGTLLAVDEGKQIAAQCNGDGSYNIMLGLRLPEDWSKLNSPLEDADAFREHILKTEFAGWHSDITNSVKHSEGPFRAWPLYAMPTEAFCWKSKDIALVGDAAHVSTPFVGEGVNSALFDTVQLAREIVKHGMDNLDLAVSAYEALMFPRAINFIERSTQSGEMLFSPDAPKLFREMASAIEVEIKARRNAAQQ